MEISQIVGKNLKNLREKRGFSLGQLAEKAGVSKMMLSQIERGDANPTINTIWKIAFGLKVPYAKLLEYHEEMDSVDLVRLGDAVEQEDAGCRIISYFTATEKRHLEYYRMEVKAGIRHDSIGHSENSREFLIVLAGSLTMTVDGRDYELEKDDAISFEAAGAHSYLARGKEDAKMAMVIYYSDDND